MVWITPGALVAGTPPDSLPRVADEEIPGEQVILKGYYVDVFPYPNEEGALPRTNVTQQEAAALCADQDKRLCSELEWERACKGPENRRYEYGDDYHPERCGTGDPPGLRPNGLRVGCQSGFGVRDMHGGVWEWTLSPWGRGHKRGLVTVRGGNGTAGELVGRCANAMGRPASSRADTVGLRCCAGPQNDAQVVLQIRRGNKLETREKVDRQVARQLEAALPDDAKRDLGDHHDLKLGRMWVWRPIGNEELVVMGGCTGLGTRPSCGVLVARVVLDQASVLAWASSGYWVPTVHVDLDPRDLWLFGGDKLGSFRRLIAYVWGGVKVGPKERRIPQPEAEDQPG
jgi:sulfatase modifying factor 1